VAFTGWFFLSGGGFSNRFGLVGRPSSREGEHCKRKTPETALRPRLFPSGRAKTVLSKALLAGPFEDLTPIDNRQLSLKALGCSICRLTVTLNG
jgi:hypothetical protein